MRIGLLKSILLSITCCAAIVTIAAEPATTPDPPPKDFQPRIQGYLKVRKEALRGIPSLKPKADAAQIEQYRKAASAAIRASRAAAQQGDVLTPEIQAFLTKIVRSETKGREGVSAKQTTKQGNPTVEAKETPTPVPVVMVNALYPDAAPVSSIPATLLQRLPKLPEELDYRFVGRHLLLRDTVGVIVDFVPNAALP